MNAELLTRIKWFIRCQIWKYTYWKSEMIVSSKPCIKCTCAWRVLPPRYTYGHTRHKHWQVLAKLYINYRKLGRVLTR